MRDPLSWSIPLFRAFGILVKLHILYIVITLGMIGRIYYLAPDQLGDYILIWVVLLFCIVLLHEFGHCFAARYVDGEAEEILMWPLGGLAFCSVPQTARANLITAIGGPLVNVVICLGTAGAMFAAGYLPPLNIFNTRQLYTPELSNWQSGGNDYAPGTGFSPYHIRKDNGETIHSYKLIAVEGKHFAVVGDKPPIEIEKPSVTYYPAWVLWSARLFWLSWMLLLFNLIPASPLDGGRILQCILWGRSGDYRSATIVACYSGMAFALLFILLSIVFNDSLLFALAAFMVFSSYQQLVMLEMGSEERGAFGYDFSKGYGGFGPEEEPAPKQRKPGFIKRWRLARRAKREQVAAQQRAADEARMDELLDKISRNGKGSLTQEELRFMERASARYRNRP
jgi:Zn-dependent protease